MTSEEAPPPRAVLYASVLVPPGVRDVLLSVAHSGASSPVWQSAIEDEIIRNGTRHLVERRGAPSTEAVQAVRGDVVVMDDVFPDACLPSTAWVPLVPTQLNHEKDRHVLAAVVGAAAEVVVTSNVHDFPARALPPGIRVETADDFLLRLLDAQASAVLAGVDEMAARLRRPPRTPAELAGRFAAGVVLRRFGAALLVALKH